MCIKLFLKIDVFRGFLSKAFYLDFLHKNVTKVWSIFIFYNTQNAFSKSISVSNLTYIISNQCVWNGIKS